MRRSDPGEHVKLTQVSTMDELTAPGNYLFDSIGRVILACPYCGGVFVCAAHRVESTSPLTLAPSIQGPPDAWRYGEEARAQVRAPCTHHFWIKEGKVVE